MPIPDTRQCSLISLLACSLFTVSRTCISLCLRNKVENENFHSIHEKDKERKSPSLNERKLVLNELKLLELWKARCKRYNNNLID